VYSLKNAVFNDIIGYYDDSIIREIITFQTYHDYPIEVFYLGCFSFVYIAFFMQSTNIKKELKIKKIHEYKDFSRCVKVFIIIFTMIFTKNIENAI